MRYRKEIMQWSNFLRFTVLKPESYGGSTWKTALQNFIISEVLRFLEVVFGPLVCKV